jgi:hypothetical protein
MKKKLKLLISWQILINFWLFLLSVRTSTFDWFFGSYFAKKAYNRIIGTSQVHPYSKSFFTIHNTTLYHRLRTRMKSCARGKHKFFFWFLLRDRLNTRNLLRRKKMCLDDNSCVLCSTHNEEDIMQILKKRRYHASPFLLNF